MGGGGIRTGIVVGVGFGIVTALAVVFFSGSGFGLLVEVVLAVVAGVVAAYLLARASAPGGPIPALPVGTRSVLLRAGITAGAVEGVVGGMAFTIISSLLISSGSFRQQMQSLLQQQGAGTSSADSLVAIATGCVACFFVLFIPAITAGLGALGAWLYSLTRPAAPAPPPPLAPLPPMPPGAGSGRVG